MRCTYIDDKGYERFCESGKLVHRHVAEKKLGRKLKGWEVVRHRNGDKLDNRPVNLYINRKQEYYASLRMWSDVADGYVLGL